MKLLGGEIWVEGDAGTGSIFRFHSAIRIFQDRPDRSGASGAPGPEGAGGTNGVRHYRALRVLMAEDNAVNRKLVSRLLEKRGYSVVTVTDGHEALAALEKEPFDVVLMDVHMPSMGGFEATAVIRKREREEAPVQGYESAS